MKSIPNHLWQTLRQPSDSTVAIVVGILTPLLIGCLALSENPAYYKIAVIAAIPTVGIMMAYLIPPVFKTENNNPWSFTLVGILIISLYMVAGVSRTIDVTAPDYAAKLNQLDIEKINFIDVKTTHLNQSTDNTEFAPLVTYKDHSDALLYPCRQQIPSLNNDVVVTVQGNELLIDGRQKNKPFTRQDVTHGVETMMDCIIKQ